MFTSLYIVHIFTSLYKSLYVCNDGFSLGPSSVVSHFSRVGHTVKAVPLSGAGVEEERCVPVGEQLLRSLTDKTNAMHFHYQSLLT